jgi:hypothetical protein
MRRWSWLVGELPIDVRGLLENERSIAPVPAATRARAIARARQALSASVQTAVVRYSAPEAMPTWAVAGVVCLIGATAGVAASAHATRDPSPRAVAAAPPAEAVIAGGAQRGTRSTADAPAAQLPLSEAPPLVERGGRRDELRLLERAHAALTREDFAAAMPPLMEHARRFKQGRLVEEREVLRMEALSGLGRQEEVRRAAAAFEVRFPRSPLRPVVQRMASSED